MLSSFVDSPLQHVRNPESRHDDWPGSLEPVLGSAAMDAAWQEITRWPGYRPTPLRSLDFLATALRLGAVHYKDESGRFGLGSFKALGGAYAVLRLLERETGLSAAAIRGGDAPGAAEITVVTATDGNHGRSVAWGAQQFGCQCRIYIHAEVSEYRERAMRELGATVTRVDGNYDHSVHVAAAEAAANGWFVVSDTSWEGYTEVPRQVMAGYTVMLREVFEQMPGGEAPTHVFVQGGVGGLAAAVSAACWTRYGSGRPRLVVVEPDRAPCLYQSAWNGAPTAVEIAEETVMAGLSCGEVSELGWSILALGGDDFVTITDDNVGPAMRALAAGDCGGGAIEAGESAVAGLCALVQLAGDHSRADMLGLDASSRVLLLGTEGATDPAIYRRIIDDRPAD